MVKEPPVDVMADADTVDPEEERENEADDESAFKDNDEDNGTETADDEIDNDVNITDFVEALCTSQDGSGNPFLLQIKKKIKKERKGKRGKRKKKEEEENK